MADLIRLDGQSLDPSLPRQLVNKAGWKDWVDEDEEDIRLIDFSSSFMTAKRPAELAQAPDMRAPETIFMDIFGDRVDLWGVGATVSNAHS